MSSFFLYTDNSRSKKKYSNNLIFKVLEKKEKEVRKKVQTNYKDQPNYQKPKI